MWGRSRAQNMSHASSQAVLMHEHNSFLTRSEQYRPAYSVQAGDNIKPSLSQAVQRRPQPANLCGPILTKVK